MADRGRYPGALSAAPALGHGLSRTVPHLRSGRPRPSPTAPPPPRPDPPRPPVTDHGLPVAVSLTRAHNRLLRTALAELEEPDPTTPPRPAYGRP